MIERADTPGLALHEALRSAPEWLMDTPRLALHPGDPSAPGGDAHGRPRCAWIVRDDLLHPYAGGNKLRKLDGVLRPLLARGVTDLVTCGGVQSAHTAALACLGAEHGAQVHALVRGTPPTPLTGMALITRLFAARVCAVPHDQYADRDAMFARYLASMEAEDTTRRVAVIPEGARAPDALWGLIRLIDALSHALPNARQTPYRIVVDTGTGTTALGLALGIALARLPWRVDAVCLIRGHEATIADELRPTLRAWFAAGHPAPALPAPAPSHATHDTHTLDHITWHPRCHPRRFGHATTEDIQTCLRVARTTGIAIDPLYTLAAWRYLQSPPHNKKPAETVWLHTGGGLNLGGVAQRWPDAFQADDTL